MQLVLATTVDIGVLNGPAIHVLNIANGLARRGHAVTLIAPRSVTGPAIALEPSVRHDAVGDARRFGVRGAVGAPLLLASIWRHRKADGLIVRASPSSILITAFARVIGMRNILVEANAWLGDDVLAIGKGPLAARLTTRLQTWEGCLAHHIRAVTQGLRDRYVEAGVPADRVVVIGNGTDLDTFRPLDRAACRVELGYEADEAVVAFVGNLWPAIDFDTALAAVVHTTLAARRVRLVIVGDGVAMPELRAKAQALAGSHPTMRIDLLGAKSPADANRVLNAADVALAPFRSARNQRIGLSPLKLRDYAAAGCPVVSSRIDGIVGEPSWLHLAEPENPAALAQAIADALLQDRAEAGRAARRYAEAHFGWDAIVRQIEAVLVR